MRIGILSWESLHSVAIGGVATHVSELAAALSRGGDEVHVLTRLGFGQSPYAFVEGVHYHRCAYDSRPDFISDIDSMCGALVDNLWQIEDYCGSIDVVHSHDWLTAKAVTWVKLGREKRVVTTIHSTEYGRCGNRLLDGASRAIRKREWEIQHASDALIAVSNFLRDEVIRIYATPSAKITTIYNGINPRLYTGLIDPKKVKALCGVSRTDPTVLFVGRLEYQKGPDTLVEAIPQVLKIHPGIRFIFVGDGDMHTSLKDRCKTLNIDSAVRFLGWRDRRRVADIYHAADIVCVPSRNEPFGIVILEAWSAAKPVIVSSNGGPSEFVWHGVTGLKTPAEPAPIALALAALLDDGEYARWMGQNGFLAVNTAFSWDHIAKNVRRVYESIVNC